MITTSGSCRVTTGRLSTRYSAYDSEFATISRSPVRCEPPASAPPPIVTTAPPNASPTPATRSTVARSRRARIAIPTVNTGIVVPSTTAVVAVVRDSPAMNSSWLPAIPSTASPASAATSRSGIRHRRRANAISHSTIAAGGVRSATTANGGSSSITRLPAIDSDANATCTASSARWTRRRDGTARAA